MNYTLCPRIKKKISRYSKMLIEIQNQILLLNTRPNQERQSAITEHKTKFNNTASFSHKQQAMNIIATKKTNGALARNNLNPRSSISL